MSNQDREQVVEHLKAAYTEGRLDKQEFDERVDRAMNAQIHADLMGIMSDLFGTPPPPPPMPYPPRHPHPHPAPPYPRTSDDRPAAAAAHFLPFIGLSVVGPLIMLLAMGRTSPYVRAQAVEALNFHLTLLGATILLSITVVGLVLVPLLWIGGLVAGIMGGVSALGDGRFRYPLSLRLVK
ncbi:DUF1707 and DUF4870 domain-containing protein [Spongiactinospora sp. 9N601]|uniref:DUF1707 and DUF4870 domain-containing protein n=1 Tax=Spongiactinospora sp. 9N601 TaxID=3375149 RepID=UPI0037AFABF2